ncbi:flavoprotein oxidoreductase [Actinobacteria bacterium YIM 96077]|uniref:Flavoprotein oxidoreductase n=1 Tax=Phytoactinopolyspora halophila TaxID=1981511 RepID=A0A329QN13_9ACTN|nr:FAD-dependent oxidoreductase [Phytoactinopolyspora halophila]AYY12327.1 flavoprotein oxidoreductase [Actinobacteria bacterium YIM 96077]RAW13755.1 flavoprotein oxidoreductase [Phytoactinopolyspora halophila]
MAERIVIIGADAAGMSAASQARRVAARSGREVELVAVDRGHWTSYSACGIPYWVGGDVDGPHGLVARSAEEHRQNGIDVRLSTEARAVDLDTGQVEVVGNGSARTTRLGFDHLVLATGAVPARPPLPGIDADGVFGVQTLDDGATVIDYLARRRPSRAVVVGAGYIGLEMAEAMVRRGLQVTVLERAPEPMTTLDPDMGSHVRTAMQGMGIEVVTGVTVEGFDTAPGTVSATPAGGSVRRVRTDAGDYDADIVVLGIGARPATQLASDAGLPLGATGGLRVDDRMRVSGHENVWAAGDCVETFHRVLASYVHVPLGTHANKQGRVLGMNLGGGNAVFPGIVGTAVSKVCDLEIARTGVSVAEADAAGLDYVTTTIESTTRAGYFPGAQPLTVKIVAERSTHRLLGGQIVGREGAAKRIDVLAVALWNGMSAGDLAMSDMSYAPPFSPVWDPVQIAARKAADELD